MKWFFEGYRRFLSPLLPFSCRFYPSCSRYAEEALTKFGILKGMRLTIVRLLCCQPFHPGGFDPVQHVKTKDDGN